MDEPGPQRVEVDGVELYFDPDPGPADDTIHTALPPKVDSWRRRSATGAILTGIALGLKQVLEPRREDTAIVTQVSGEPVDDLPVEAHLDGIKPANSVVMIRPWLLDDGDHLAACEAVSDVGGPPDDTPPIRPVADGEQRLGDER